MSAQGEKMETKRQRGWVFTLNNYTEEEYNQLINTPRTKYICIGKEKGESGTPHLQGYIEWVNPQRLSGLKKINKRAHWEPRRGTPQEAAMYCQKEGDFDELGELPMENGKRRGLQMACDEVLKGTPIEEVATMYPSEFVRYSGGLKSLNTIKVKPRDPKEPPHVVWLWGLAGVGKTREAYEAHEKVYIKDGTQWWDGYDGQTAIIIDDFEVVEWNYRDLLRLLDRYPYRGQFKGGYVNINSPYIYITCEHHPSYIWSGNKLSQVTRRLTEIKNIVAQGNLAQGDIGNTNYVTDACVEKAVFARIIKPLP